MGAGAGGQVAGGARRISIGITPALPAPAHPLSPAAAPSPQSRQDTEIQPLVTGHTLVSSQFSEGGGWDNILLCYGGVSHVTVLQ